MESVEQNTDKRKSSTVATVEKNSAEANSDTKKDDTNDKREESNVTDKQLESHNDKPEELNVAVKQLDSHNDKEPSHSGQKRKSSPDSDSLREKKRQRLDKKAKIHGVYEGLILPEHLMKELDYPRQDPSGEHGRVKLYGNHFGFKEGYCKRCDKSFDTTFSRRTQCDFHLERSKRYNGRQQPHGCCGRSYGSRGCRTAPSHVHKGNLYQDLENYKVTEKKDNPTDKYTIYAVDTESVHTMKGIEVCRVTVVDRKLNVVYNEFCLPTTKVVDYNTIWSGISEKDLQGVTKTFEDLREDMLKLFSADTILVGHGLSSDLIAMKIMHEKVIDTLYLYPHHRGWPLKRSLKDIALSELGMRIQDGDGHDSAEDAIAAMKLVRKRVLPMIKRLKKE